MFTTLANVLNRLTGLIGGNLANLLMGVAFVVFLLAVINFIWKRAKGGKGYGEDNGLQQAKNMLGWSIVGMFVMVAIWGIIAFISSNTGIGVGGTMYRPQTCFSDNCVSQQQGGGNTEERRCNQIGGTQADHQQCFDAGCTWYPQDVRCGARP